MPRPLLTRSAAWAVAAFVLAPCVVALSGLTVSSASASVAEPRQAGATVPVSLAITSVSPQIATPGKPVTVSGTLTNISHDPMSGLSIWLRSSGTRFGNRESLHEYASGTIPFDSPVNGAVANVTKPLAPRATVRWSITLRGAQLPMTDFGVYPLAAQANSADLTPLAASRTFLPFWPGKKGPGDPVRQDVAWIWPLIDQPRQAICGLLDNSLAASFSSGGRLGGLLQAGRAYSRSAHLTWAIDPALFTNVATMSRPYHAGGTAGCHGSPQRASQSARTWLAGVKAATAGQPVFVTPYDDADIAALTRYNLKADLYRSFTEGRQVAEQVLGRSLSPAAAGTAGSTNAIAWPANGTASGADLANLAASDKISTVVLDSSAMPAPPEVNFTPSSQATTQDGTGSGMKVLLSDDTITQLVGSASAASGSQATTFSVEQRYLAETAMIAAERPNLARSIVVAPPRRWDPPGGLASALLNETVHAPWLRPVTLTSLAAVKDPAGQVDRQALPRRISGARLARSLVTEVRQLDQQVELLTSIQTAPNPNLERSVFAIESSAWRDGGQAGQQTLADEISADVARQESKLRIVVTKGEREQLTGRTGTVPVLISNRNNYAVRVRLQADAGGGVTVKKQPATQPIPADALVIVKLPVTATAIGSTTLTLSLLTPSGIPIPGARATMTIQATHYGTLALVIIAAVLGVFMISSGIRTFRRRGRRGRDGAADAGPSDTPPEPGDVAPAPPELQGRAEKSDTVVSDRIKNRRASLGPFNANTGHANGHDQAGAEEMDDYAWAPGWTDRR
jgi:hypothetical protein